MSFIRRADQPIYNQSDVIEALKYSTGINPYDPTALGRYDYNQDGIINISDVTGIGNYNKQYAIDKLKRDAGIQPEPPTPTPMTMRRPTFVREDIVPFGGDDSMSIGNPGYRSRPSMPDMDLAVSNSGIGGAFAKSIRNLAPGTGGSGIPPIDRTQIGMPEPSVIEPPGFGGRGTPPIDRREIGAPDDSGGYIQINKPRPGKNYYSYGPDVIQPPGFGGRGIPPSDRRLIGGDDGFPGFGEITGGPARPPIAGVDYLPPAPRYNPPQYQRRTPTQQMNPLQMLQQRLMQQRAMQQRMNPMMGMGLGGFNQPMGRFGGMGGRFPGQMFGMPQNRFGGIGFGGFGGGFPGMMFGSGGGYNPYQQRPQFGYGFGQQTFNQFQQPQQQGNMGYGFGQQTFNQFQQPQQQNQYRFGAMGY